MAKLYQRATTGRARSFIKTLIAAVPYRIHTLLTDNGIQFADLPKHRQGVTAQLRGHPFDRVCFTNSIEHRLTKPNHPWTNGQVERMNRTLKEAAVKRYYYQSHSQLEEHLDAFVSAYHFARRQTLKGLTPYEFIVKTRADKPHLFHFDPTTPIWDCTPTQIASFQSSTSSSWAGSPAHVQFIRSESIWSL